MAVTSLAVVNVGQLVTADPHLGSGALGVLTNGALLVDEGRVAWVGPSSESEAAGATLVDAEGRCVIPGFVDSHAHLVFAGDRAGEFAKRAVGSAYRPGGILTTVAATRAASTASLEAHARALRVEALYAGTTTMESKSGYGLTVDDERRSCTVAAGVADVATFLGAHVVAPEFTDSDAYVDLVVGPMLDACAASCRFIDVFCEIGAFDADQSRTVLAAGAAAGLLGKIHANQLGHGQGVQVAVAAQAVSADHCTFLDNADVDALASSTTIATLLPITEFATRSPYADARRLLDAGASVALASNCNPGSGYSSSMPFAIALAVRELGMTPDEALLAATVGGARALSRNDVGALREGMRADFVLLEAADPIALSYRPGMDHVRGVWRNGERAR